MRFALRGTAAFIVFAAAGIGLFVYLNRGSPSPALEELRAEAVWRVIPSGSAVWEGPATAGHCSDSSPREWVHMGVFVADAAHALEIYDEFLRSDGWTISSGLPRDFAFDDRRIGAFTARKTGARSTMELIVLGYPERGRVLVGPAGGEAVPEGRPEGFDDESDYVVLEGRAEPQCATQR